MGVFIRHEHCDACGSSDGKAIYEDGSHYCWVCGDTKASDDYIAELKKQGKPVRVRSTSNKGEILEVKQSNKPPMTKYEWDEIKENTQIDPEGYRGLRKDTCAKFGVRHTFNGMGEVTEQYYPCTKNGEIVGVKVREVPKDFRTIGQVGIDCDLFMQFKFNRGGKYLILAEGECFTPDTQVLVENKGWVSLKDYSEGKVMQGDGTFAHPIAVVKKSFTGNLVNYKSGSYNVLTTPEHNMVRLDKNGNQIKVKANDSTKKHLVVPRTVKYKPSNVSDRSEKLARIQVMLSADFTFREGGDIYGSLKKERKIQRAKMLLDDYGVRYTVTKTKNGYTSFFIHRGHNLDVSKEFKYDRDINYSDVIIDEFVHWDGNSVPNRNQLEFNTVILSNAEFIQTCAHLNGKVSTVIRRTRDKYSWYKVSVLNNKSTSSTQNGFTEIPYDGQVMCLTMPSGTLLIRHNESISVSGNCDALSAYQMMNDYNKQKYGENTDLEFAAVTSMVGANGYRQIAAQYRFFDSFENIIIAYDNDTAGKKATDEIVKHLPKGKVKIMNLRYKDPNEYLMKDDAVSFVRDFYESTPYTPVNVLGSGGLYDKIVAQSHTPKLPFPKFMDGLNDMLVGGIPLGHIINIAAATGGGKTTLVNEIIYDWIFNSPHMIGVVSMELDSGQYGETLLSRHLRRKISLIRNQDEKIKLIESDKTKEKAQELFFRPDGQHRFFLLDNRDGSIEEMQDTIEELIVSCGCKIIVLDPLQDIMAGLSNEEQEVFMKWSKGMIKSHNVTFIYINHVRKSASGSSSSGEGASFNEEDIQGSSTIIKSASANILLYRNKYAEDPIDRNTTKVMLAKNRICGITGPAGEIYYDNETHTLHNKAEYFT